MNSEDLENFYQKYKKWINEGNMGDIENYKQKKDSEYIYQIFHVILEKYGYTVEDWYTSNYPNKEDNGKHLIRKIKWYHVKNSGLEIIQTIWEYDKLKNKTSISHYKSFISFSNVIKISYSPENKEILMESSTVAARLRNIVHLYDSWPPEHCEGINLNLPIEKFHRLLIRKFDEFCEHEYNKRSFSKADEIKKFNELLNEGIITEEEFQLFKDDLLKS